MVGAVLICLMFGAVTRAESPENLATRAKVSANSEYSEDYLATWAIDGKIPAACSKQDLRQAWCVRGIDTQQTGVFTLAWDRPVEVAEIVYFGRTGQLVEECFKDYEVYLDDAPEPVVRGVFERRHGAQRITIPKTTVRNVRLKFLAD